MSKYPNPFDDVDTSKILLIEPRYQPKPNVIVPLDLDISGLDATLIISADEGEVVNLTKRLEIFNYMNGGALSHCMGCISATSKGENLVTTMLEVEKIHLLTDHLKTAKTDINKAINQWLMIGDSLDRQVSHICFEWYELDK